MDVILVLKFCVISVALIERECRFLASLMLLNPSDLGQWALKSARINYVVMCLFLVWFIGISIISL